MSMEQWVIRNGSWLKPLVCSLVLILAPVVMEAGAISIPTWVKVVGTIGGCVGLITSGIMVMFSETATAKFICYGAMVVAYAFVIIEFFHWLKG